MIWITGSTKPQFFASISRQLFPTMESRLALDAFVGQDFQDCLVFVSFHKTNVET